MRLALAAGTMVLKERLLEDLWAGDAVSTSTNTVQSKVSRLRRALGDPGLVVGGRTGYTLAIDARRRGRVWRSPGGPTRSRRSGWTGTPPPSWTRARPRWRCSGARACSAPATPTGSGRTATQLEDAAPAADRGPARGAAGSRRDRGGRRRARGARHRPSTARRPVGAADHRALPGRPAGGRAGRVSHRAGAARRGARDRARPRAAATRAAGPPAGPRPRCAGRADATAPVGRRSSGGNLPPLSSTLVGRARERARGRRARRRPPPRDAGRPGRCRQDPPRDRGRAPDCRGGRRRLARPPRDGAHRRVGRRHHRRRAPRQRRHRGGAGRAPAAAPTC